MRLRSIVLSVAAMGVLSSSPAFAGAVLDRIQQNKKMVMSTDPEYPPQSSLNASNQGLYEPSHGSAPDIAGKGVANPLATILSAAMMLRFSLNQAEAADRIESAVKQVLAQGLRTADIWSEGTTRVGTREMGDAVVAAITKKTITG